MTIGSDQLDAWGRTMTMTDPNGCRWCGEAMRGHGIRLTEPAGVHGYTEPTDEQRLNRMRARRETP